MSLVNFDNASTADNLASSTLTFSHTVGTQDDMILLVAVRTTGVVTISSVTYNGVALTFLNGASNVARLEFWYLIAPPTGANNVVITTNIAATSIQGGASSYYGVDQENPILNNNTAVGSSGALSVTVTSNPDDMVVDAAGQGASSVLTVGGSQTQRWNDTAGINTMSGSDKEATSTSTTMTWSGSVSGRWISSALALSPVAPNRSSLMLTGIGI